LRPSFQPKSRDGEVHVVSCRPSGVFVVDLIMGNPAIDEHSCCFDRCGSLITSQSDSDVVGEYWSRFFPKESFRIRQLREAIIECRNHCPLGLIR